MKEWTNSGKERSAPEPINTWWVGGCRVTEFADHNFYTFYKGERANNGMTYKSLLDAQDAVIAWACNQAINDLRELGIDHGITIPKMKREALTRTCRHCNKEIKRGPFGTYGDRWNHVDEKGLLAGERCYPADSYAEPR